MSNIDPMEHTGLIHMVLNTHTWLFADKSPWTYDDAFQEGFIALLEALETYDSEQGAISTYCINNIKWKLYRAFRDQNSLIRKPDRLYDIQSAYKKIQLEYLQAYGEEPDIKYMAAQMKMTVPELKQFLDLFAPIRSLDTPINDTEDLTLGDIIEDERDNFEAVEIELHLAQLRKDLERMMDEKLTAPDQKILKEYYAWDGGKQPTIKELAEKNNCTLEITRRKIRNALSKLYKFKRELVRNYPDVIMSQIYTQYQPHLTDLKSMSREMLKTYLYPGDLVQINQNYGVVLDVEKHLFYFKYADEFIIVLFDQVIDFEMKDSKVTRIFKRKPKQKEIEIYGTFITGVPFLMPRSPIGAV